MDEAVQVKEKHNSTERQTDVQTDSLRGQSTRKFTPLGVLKDLKETHLVSSCIYSIRHYFRVQLFSRFWPGAAIREVLISRFC